MKKLFLALILGIMLTGCDKAMKCTYSVKNDTMNIKKTYKVYSDNNSVTKVKGNISYEILDDNLNKNFDTMVVIMKSDFEDKNIPFEYKNKGNKYIFDVTYNVDSMSDDVFNELIVSKNLSEYKEKLINDGFKCK